ncbi:hypothetical protein [Falsirhodobacter sp. 1013]
MKELNVKISEDRVRYLKMLAAQTGRSSIDLVEEAMDLLRKQHG